MATTYQQEFSFDSGYVKFSITPELSRGLVPGDTVTIQGTVQNSFMTIKHMEFRILPDHYTYYMPLWQYGMVCNVAKNKVGTFSFTFTMPSVSSFWSGSARISKKLPFIFAISDNADPDKANYTDISSSPLFEDPQSVQVLSVLRYRLTPKILAMDFERAALSGGKYTYANDGQYLMCKDLRISKAALADASEITVAKIVCKGSDGSSRSVNLTTAQIKAALTTAGYSETIPKLFTFVSALGVTYTLTLTLGDAYDQVTFADTAMRAFARMHISGAAKGGVAVGKFSAATDTKPMFEVAEDHETHILGTSEFGREAAFCGGIAGVTNYVEGEVKTGGTWIDGKPIYRYVWKGTTSLSGAQGQVATLPAKPSTMITLRGMIDRSDGAWMPITNMYYSNISWAANIRTDGDTGILVGLGSSYSGSHRIIVIAEYTK